MSGNQNLGAAYGAVELLLGLPSGSLVEASGEGMTRRVWRKTGCDSWSAPSLAGDGFVYSTSAGLVFDYPRLVVAVVAGTQTAETVEVIEPDLSVARPAVVWWGPRMTRAVLEAVGLVLGVVAIGWGAWGWAGVLADGFWVGTRIVFAVCLVGTAGIVAAFARAVWITYALAKGSPVASVRASSARPVGEPHRVPPQSPGPVTVHVTAHDVPRQPRAIGGRRQIGSTGGRS